jgi:ribosomal protein L40E
MFGFLKRLFRRKKKEEVPSEQPKEVPLEAVAAEEPKPQEKKAETAVVEGREQKVCPKCGAPNDKFVHKCWLCKSDI